MFGFLKSSQGQTLEHAYPSLPNTNNGYQTNNQYSKFPPLMEDGRTVLASWQPEAAVNESILRREGIQSNWQYRKYLTKNGDELRENMYHEALNDVGFTIRNENKSIDSASFGTPMLYGSLLEPVSHKGASLSDLKDNYLTREQLQSKMIVPEITQEQLIQMKPQ